jgi:hypothetical protein
MLVYYFTQIERPYAEAADALLDFPEGLSVPAGAAYRAGEELHARVGLGRLPIAKTVRLEVGTPVRTDERTTLPLRWEATGPTSLFPRMDADIVLEPLGADYAHLSFRGSYDPPLGPVGAAADRLVLHRVAEATVRRFTDAVAWTIKANGRVALGNGAVPSLSRH